MGAKLLADAGLGVVPGFGRFRLGTKNACGLVSRCGHQRLPTHKYREVRQPESRPSSTSHL
jgi:hypothetical protein